MLTARTLRIRSMTRVRPSLYGNPGCLQVARARTELRSGRPVRVRGPADARIAIPVDTLRPDVLAALAQLPDADLRLALTRERAAALGHVRDEDVSVRVAADVSLAELRAWAAADEVPSLRDVASLGDLAGARAAKPEPGKSAGARAARPDPGNPSRADVLAERATPVERAAIELAKHSLLLPTVLSARDDDAACAHLLAVETSAIAAHTHVDALDLERIAEASVPLADVPTCRFVVFRDRRDGSEHVAVLVGRVQPAQVTDVRVHSACLTGDLLGSLRCDCGDQLRGAVRRFADLGAGVLLYLGQEGRGIGLANKLRAYRLQESGLDTIDADRHLGFAGDERRYELAAALLRELGITHVRLHTNNPRKAGALASLGVTVVEFRTLAGAVNPHNESYIRVRRERAGHLGPDGQ